MIENRPWGSFEVLCQESNYKVKRLIIKPNSRISLQSHNNRAEYWTMVEGLKGELLLNHKIIDLKQGDTVVIKPKDIHRITNCSSTTDLVIIEVQTGKCDEEDITRYADDYNRV